MIVQHAPLVRHVVGRLAMSLPRHVEIDDLIGYGAIGLIEAVDRYDAQRGVAFEAFARERIWGSAMDAMRAADPVPNYTRRRAKEIQRAFVDIEAQLGRPPRDEEVAAHLGLTVTQMHRAMVDVSRTPESIHRIIQGDAGEAELLDYLSDPDAPSPEETLDRRELHAAVVRALGRLDERERLILSLYYERDLTLHEIGEVVGLSDSRVWQVHARAITRIRAYLQADGTIQAGARS